MNILSQLRVKGCKFHIWESYVSYIFKFILVGSWNWLFAQTSAPRIIMHIFMSFIKVTHHLTIESLMACSPYTSQSWWWMSAGAMFLASKKQIIDHISHAAGFSIFLNIVNTQDDA
jgi:hypothetical protein